MALIDGADARKYLSGQTTHDQYFLLLFVLVNFNVEDQTGMNSMAVFRTYDCQILTHIPLGTASCVQLLAV